MKKTTKILSVVLAFMMLLGTMSTALCAGAVNYSKVKDFQLDSEESAGLLLDYVDNMLAENAAKDEKNHGQLKVNIPVLGDILIDYTSIDKALSTVYSTLDNYKGALRLLGDAKDLKFGMLKGAQRSGGDLKLVYTLIDFLAQNTGLFQKVINGKLSLGAANTFINVNDEITKMVKDASNGEANDIPGLLRYFIYKGTLGGKLGYPDSMAASGLKTADEVLNAFLNTYLTTDATSDFNGKALLPSLNGKLKIDSGSVYDLLATAIAAAYKDLAVTPFNTHIKALLAEYACGAVKTDITATVTEAEKALVAAGAANPDTALTSAGFAAVDGGFILRSGDQYFKFDTANVNSLFGVFDFGYALPADFNFVAADGTITSNLNNILGTVVKTVLSDEYDAKVNWVDGGNDLLVTNFANLAKTILPVCPDSFFESFLDAETIDKIKNFDENADPVELINYFVNILIKVLVPDVVSELADADEFMEVGAVVANHYAKLVAPTIDYSAKIYNGDKIAEKTDEQWVDLVLDLGMEVAAYYLDLYTNFDVDTDKMASYKTAASDAKVTLADFLLDDVVDWAFGYADGVFAAGDDLKGARGKYDNKGGWYKLNVIVNNILPLQFLNGTSGDSEFAVDMEYAMNKLVGEFLGLDVAEAVKVIAKNNNAGNILNDTPVTAVLKVVQSVINSILPGTIDSKYITNVETLISKDSLSALIANLLSALNSRKDKIIPPVLPIVLSFLDDFVDDTSLVLKADHNEEANSVDFKTVLSQKYAKSFGVADGVANGTPEKVTIVKAGTLIAGDKYMKSKNLKTLTLKDADNKNVYNIESYKFYNDNANAENGGYYVFCASVTGLDKMDADKEIYAISYITYLVGKTQKTAYSVNGYSVHLDVPGK